MEKKTGRIRDWGSLTEEQKQSGEWVEYPKDLEKEVYEEQRRHYNDPYVKSRSEIRKDLYDLKLKAQQLEAIKKRSSENK